MTDIAGDNDDNTLSGGAANDTIIGGGGDDLLQGSDGDDLLRGDDTVPGDDGALTLTSTAHGYLDAGNSLIGGLGGAAGFGESILARNDDGSTQRIDLSNVFTNGLNFFGTVFTGLYLNNNGNVTFNFSQFDYTPEVITGNTNNPLIAAFFADVDTRNPTVPGVTPGGASTGTNLLYYDLDAVNHVFTATWDDVGYFANHNDKLSAFQLQIVDRGAGDFDFIFRYEAINWTTGDASQGTGGFGGIVARAGFTAGNGVNFFELPQSGNQSAILGLDTAPGNNGRPGVWIFQVRNGSVNVAGADILEGGEGNDTLIGALRDDTLDGGAGTDVAVFSGALGAYAVSQVDATTFTVTGPDGADRLSNVELGRFGGGPAVPLTSIADRPVIQLAATGDRPLDMTSDFALSPQLVAGLVPVAASLQPGGFTIQYLNGAELVATASSYALTLPGATTGERSLLTEGGFAPVVDAMTTALAANGATIGGAALNGSALQAALQQLAAEIDQLPPDAITLASLSAEIDGDPHYAFSDLAMLGIEISPFLGGLLVPGRSIDLPGLIESFGLRPNVIEAGAGNDTLVALGGQSTISGGNGIDTIYVPESSQTADITTGAGQTTVAGSFGSVTLTGIEAVNFSDATQVLSGNLPVLSISDATASEGTNGTVDAVFNISLTAAAPAGGVSAEIDLSGFGDHPALLGVDFNLSSLTITIPAGATTSTLTIPILGDTLPELDETFLVTLRNATNAIPGFDSSAIGTIANDDLVPIVSITSAQTSEGSSGTRNLSFTINLSMPTGQTVTVPVSTTNGSGAAGGDYTSVDTVATIPAGETSITVVVPVLGDAGFEINETFLLALGNPTGGAALDVSAATAIGTIRNDDAASPAELSGITLAGTPNDDFLVGGQAADLLNGANGNDVLLGDEGSDILIGGAGDDTAIGGDIVVVAIGGSDVVLPDNLEAGNDFIDLGTGNNFAFAGGGNDTILGAGGNDLLAGEAGDDMVLGGDGNNALYGGDGDDTMDGGNGVDIVFGMTGDDVMVGFGEFDIVIEEPAAGGGSDFIDVGDGGSQIFAGAGDDTVLGGAGDDFMLGEDGADLMSGGNGNDALIGGSSDDTLDGGAGNDILIAEGGDDRLVDGGGDNTLTGGAGVDVFVFPSVLAGVNQITDFLAAEDSVELPAAFGLTAADARAQLVQLGLDAVLDLPTGGAVVFVGIQVASLAADDFLIV